MDIGDNVRLRCPKCRSNNLLINDWYSAVHETIIENGIIVDFTADLSSLDLVGKVTAVCDECKHRWRVRNVNDAGGLIIKRPKQAIQGEPVCKELDIERNQ